MTQIVPFRRAQTIQNLEVIRCHKHLRLQGLLTVLPLLGPPSLPSGLPRVLALGPGDGAISAIAREVSPPHPLIPKMMGTPRAQGLIKAFFRPSPSKGNSLTRLLSLSDLPSWAIFLV